MKPAAAARPNITFIGGGCVDDAIAACGKNDAKLQLLRFEPEHAQTWLNENSLWAGIKFLLGRDPDRSDDSSNGSRRRL